VQKFNEGKTMILSDFMQISYHSLEFQISNSLDQAVADPIKTKKSD
jgi:hypothetical protein